MMKGMERDYAGKTAGLDEMIAQFPSSALVPSALLEKPRPTPRRTVRTTP